jgi:hypothetical protein
LTDTGYIATVDPDPRLGYPRELQKDDRTFLLASLHPKDPLWEAADVPEEQRAWSLFYVAADEWLEPEPADGQRRYPVAPQEAPQVSLVDTFADAQGIAQATGGEIPTSLEWRLAALKLRGNGKARGFFGGAYEWCYADDGLTPSVCGGPPLLVLPENLRNIVPLPEAEASPAEVWAWLRHPLVSQGRQYGDGLTGVRTVLRVHPAGRP